MQVCSKADKIEILQNRWVGFLSVTFFQTQLQTSLRNSYFNRTLHAYEWNKILVVVVVVGGGGGVVTLTQLFWILIPQNHQTVLEPELLQTVKMQLLKISFTTDCRQHI